MRTRFFNRNKLAAAVTAACMIPAVTMAAMPTESTSPYATTPINLQGAAFVPPNVMLLLDQSGSMLLDTDPNLPWTWNLANPNARINVAARTITTLFQSNTNVRWGFSTFRGGEGTLIRQVISDFSPTHLTSLTSAVETTRAATVSGPATPMYAGYTDMVHYFAGTYQSRATPVQYRCQKNYIMLVGDGIPTDAVPSSDPILGTISPANFTKLAEAAYKGNLGLSGNDLDGKPFTSADYPRQFVSTYTIGFTTDLALFRDAAAAAGGQYFTADNEAELTEAFQKTIQDIVSKNSSVPAPVSISQPSTGAIQVGFNTEDWSGSVKTYTVDVNGNIGTTATNAVVPAAGSRMIFASYGSSTRTFAEIDPANTAMKADTTTFGANPEWTLRFLAGEEPTTDTTWRKRKGNLLGDFINTEPVSLNDGDDFVAGSNDGLVHYFWRNNSNHPYSELFAYAPSATLSKTQYVAKRDYGQSGNPHRYLADGALVTQDLFGAMGGGKQILVGSLGRGGKGLFALDLDNATANSPSGIHTNVGLWDLNSEDLGVWNGGLNMGYTFGRPVIAKIKQPLTPSGSEPWAVIAGNGYDSSDAWPGNKSSGIFFFNAKTGTRMGNVMLSTDGSNPGIGGLAVMDSDNDGVADFIYAGDRNGDLWRIDLKDELHGTNPDPSKNTKAYKIWEGNSSQPITMTPTLYRINNDEVMVLFGTGSMLKDSDKNDTTQQSVYGIRDNISTVPTTYSYTTDRAATGRLIQQTIVEEKNDSGESYRKVSQNAKPADGSKSGGWYLDLSIGTNSAERVTQSMMVLSNGVFFTTQIPTVQQSDRCKGGGGDGWTMALSAVTGSAPVKPVMSPAQVNFTSGASTVAGYKNSAAGMPSALGLISSNVPSSSWSSYKSLSGMINNQMNYMDAGLLAGLKMVFTGEDGQLYEKGVLADSSTMQGYRTSWREVI